MRRPLLEVTLVLLLIPILGIISFQQRWLVIFHMGNSQAMWPTIQTDDLVLAESVFMRFFEPQSGEMIIFDSDGIVGLEELHGQDPAWLYVQRLVAKPGDSVRIADGELTVNGKSWDPVEWDGQIEPGSFLAESKIKTVPAESYFVIADHYSVGEDSRYWGWVPRDNLVARVLWVFRTDE